MTEDQKKYISAMKKASTKQPLKALPRPVWKPQAVIFGIVINKKFDMIIMAFIGLNMVTIVHNAGKDSLVNKGGYFIACSYGISIHAVVDQLPIQPH
jgi:hypothetical protein